MLPSLGSVEKRPVEMICIMFDRIRNSKAKFLLLHIAPVTPDATAVSKRSGSIRMPASTGERPLTIWNRWGRLKIVIRNGKPVKKADLETSQD